MTGLFTVILGGALAVAAFVSAFFAGSDAALIRGHSRYLIAGGGILLIAALMLEYHA